MAWKRFVVESTVAPLSHMRITWNELTVAFAEDAADDFLSEWRWLVGDSVQLMLISSLGDMFLADKAGHVHWLDAGTGQLTEVAGSFDEFQQLRREPENAEEWFVPLLVGDIIESGARLAPGECFGYKLAPIVGGQMEPCNFQPTNLSVHFSILGQLNRQAKDLPEGTSIARFSTAEPDT